MALLILKRAVYSSKESEGFPGVSRQTARNIVANANRNYKKKCLKNPKVTSFPFVTSREGGYC